MTIVTAEQARNQFGDIISKAAYGRERTIVTRRGKRFAAIISIEDLEILETFLDQVEDKIDSEYCAKALKSFDIKNTVSLEDIKARLNLE